MNAKRKTGMKRGIVLLPNLLTTANMFCGFFSIIHAMNGKLDLAVWLIILATLFDFLDGRVARMTGSESDFGTQYDSLADLCTFCMAPAILAYQWGVKDFGRFGIAACFLYFCCGALRLARFNVQSKDVEKKDFQGLPSPAAAIAIASYTLCHKFFLGDPETPPILLLFLLLGVGLLMVSNVRYKSAKAYKGRANFFILICVVALIFLIASEPDIMIFAFIQSYIFWGVIGWILKSPQKIRGLKQFFARFYDDTDDASFETENESEEQEDPSNLFPLKRKDDSKD